MSIRKSSRGSASGGGASNSVRSGTTARRISTHRSDGGGSPSTIRPPGAATISIAERSAVNGTLAPAGESGPNSRTQRAS